MKLSIVGVAVCCLLSTALSGCSLDKLSKSDSQGTPNQASVPADKSSAGNAIKEGVHDDLQALKAQLAQQQQRIEVVNNEQQALQEQLKRQQVTLQVYPTANANAGRNKQGTASTAYIAFLEDESQFSEVEEIASKEISVIPNRDSSIKLSIPPDTRFIAIKVGLRYTKKRSQLFIPISSIDFDSPLALNIGACDINIKGGYRTRVNPFLCYQT